MDTPLIIQRKSDHRYLVNFELAPETPGNGPRPLQVAWTIELAEAFTFDSGDPPQLMAALAIKRLLGNDAIEIITHPDPALYQAAMQRRFQAEVASAKAVAIDTLKALQDKLEAATSSRGEGVMVAAIIASAVVAQVGRDKLKPDRDLIRKTFITYFDGFLQPIYDEQAKILNKPN